MRGLRIVDTVLLLCIAVASLSGCSQSPREDGPLTFGGEHSPGSFDETCMPSPAGRDVFVGHIADNSSRAPVRITAVWAEGASGVETLDQVILPLINNTGFYIWPVPSKDPRWQRRVRVQDSWITTDDRISVGLVVRRTEKAKPGRIERIVVEYTWDDKKYIAKGALVYVIADKCKGL